MAGAQRAAIHAVALCAHSLLSGAAKQAGAGDSAAKLPEDLKTFLARALGPDAEQRPKDVQEFWLALDAVLSKRPAA
ncbi:MAG: hypothetical protein HY922_03885 [Elusimicrobia bacterium]|nr:hypothetical protein [Elusimicrobiota bacterium]